MERLQTRITFPSIGGVCRCVPGRGGAERSECPPTASVRPGGIANVCSAVAHRVAIKGSASVRSAC